MKRSVYGALFVVSVGLTSSAIAQASNLDVLRALYNAGTGAAAATDFPEENFDGSWIGAPKNICTIVDGSDQPYFFDISRTVRVTPAAGPLIPEKREEKLVFGGNLQQSYDLFADPTVVSTDLVLINPIYRTWVDGNQGVIHFVPATLMARKSGDYIAFQISIKYNSSSVQDELYYGYCYPPGKALF